MLPTPPPSPRFRKMHSSKQAAGRLNCRLVTRTGQGCLACHSQPMIPPDGVVDQAASGALVYFLFLYLSCELYNSAYLFQSTPFVPELASLENRVTRSLDHTFHGTEWQVSSDRWVGWCMDGQLLLASMPCHHPSILDFWQLFATVDGRPRASPPITLQKKHSQQASCSSQQYAGGAEKETIWRIRCHFSKRKRELP